MIASNHFLRSRAGVESISYGLSFPLPKEAAERILKTREEMGIVMDELLSTKGASKTVGGVIQQLTNGVLSRSEMWESALISAFIPFLNPTLYSQI